MKMHVMFELKVPASFEMKADVIGIDKKKELNRFSGTQMVCDEPIQNNQNG